MAKTISFVKGKGSLRHNNREFIANNIDEARVPWNTVYIQKPLQEAYEEISLEYRIYSEAVTRSIRGNLWKCGK